MNGRVGFRFHPTDEELVDYFLRQKINGTLLCDDIRLIDICKFEPWDLPKYAAQGSNDDEWYFFHKRVPINRNSRKLRYNRSTQTGHWKPTGKVRSVKAKHSRLDIGEKRTLVFYEYTTSKKEQRTNWVIHEYEPKQFPSYQADLVLCKLKEKADDKAECSTSRQGPPGFDGLPQSETMISNTWGQPFQIDEGISIDDLELSDDIFQSGSNDANEMDASFLGAFTDVEEAAHTHLGHSSSAPSQNGIYLDDLTDMDTFYGMVMPSPFGDSNLNNGHSGPREYRQMQTVQSLTETLPPPKLELQTCFENLPSIHGKSAATKNVQSHEKINSTRKAYSRSPVHVEAHAGLNKHKLEAKMAAGKSEFQLKLSGPSELKARDATMPGTDQYLPFKSPKEKIAVETEKRVTASNCCCINWETSMLYQKRVAIPVSVYIINVCVGLVLFVAAVGDLLILH